MTRSADSAPAAFRPHNHARCIKAARARAREIVERRGLRLTAARDRVLEILLESHRALGAYEILDRLRAAGAPAQPPAAYRALDFLVAHGLAHRIERLNAFVACADPEHSHPAAFLICRDCGAVGETEAAPLRESLAGTAEDAGFALGDMVIEAEGLCPACRPGA